METKSKGSIRMWKRINQSQRWRKMPYRNYFINKLFLGEMDSQSNLVSISILAKDVGHFKECLAAVLTSSVENTLFNTIDYLFIEVFVL